MTSAGPFGSTNSARLLNILARKQYLTSCGLGGQPKTGPCGAVGPEGSVESDSKVAVGFG